MRLWSMKTDGVNGYISPSEVSAVKDVVKRGSDFQKHVDEEIEKRKEEERIALEERNKINLPEHRIKFNPSPIVDFNKSNKK